MRKSSKDDIWWPVHHDPCLPIYSLIPAGNKREKGVHLLEWYHVRPIQAYETCVSGYIVLPNYIFTHGAVIIGLQTMIWDVST